MRAGWSRLWTRWLTRPRVMPESPLVTNGLATTGNAPLCLLLETDSSLDMAVVQRLMASPTWQAAFAERNHNWPGATLLCMQRWVGRLRNRRDHRVPTELRDLVSACLIDPEQDVSLVPVSVFWGRAPGREASWLSVPFAETWLETGAVRRVLSVLINGRQLLVQLGEPISLRSVLAEATDGAAARKVARVCRQALHRQRAAMIGPEIASRRSITAQVLRSQVVRQAMRSEMKAKQLTREQAMLAAEKCVREIAANYSHVTVNLLARLFTRIWNRLYDGVELHHFEQVQALATTHEIVYVPCHRSHMDYLLLSYVIFQKGYAVPHIAAGLNLNLPVVGGILRQGGAFFIRRSFAGNALYTAVFTQYLSVMMARGHAIEYFIEGGRSRTGRLLSPKTGALTMTVRSFLRKPLKPVVFVPVYFGYERLVEGRTYIHELSGKPKQTETLLNLFKALPALRQRFGKVHVSIGEPITLDDMLNDYAPDWRQQPLEERPTWLNPLVNDLAVRVMRNINSAAYVTPINLIALVLLAMPKQAMLEADLLRQLKLYAALLKAAPYSSLMGVTDLGAEQMIAYAEGLGVLQRHAQQLGDVLSMREHDAVQLTYFRNNVLHLMALPSALAACFLNNRQVRTEDLQRLAWRIYPYLADELFMRWSEAELPAVIDELLRALAALGLLESHDDGASWTRPAVSSAESVQLSVLGQLSMQVIERYYLAIALLLRAGSGRINQEALETQCQQMAQRMSLLYELNSPEFFDKSLFKNFLNLARQRGVLGVNAEGRLTYTDMLFAVADDAQLVLHEQIRNSVLQVTHR